MDLAVTKLAAPALAPWLPLPFPLLDASVQKVLIDAPGVFADVGDQPITAEALAAASRTLGAVANPDAPDATPLVRDMLRVHAAATSAHSATHYLPHEAYAAAAERINELGAVIVFLPTAPDVGAAKFLHKLAEHGEVIEPTVEPLGTMVIHASDADDEIRSVARLVRKHLAGGTPGHRIGVFYANADPYLRLIHEPFGSSRIEFAGEQCHTLENRPTGRSLRRLLSIDTDIMPRRELLSILSERAVRWSDATGTSLPLRRAERLTRSSIKIVGGADWERLAAIDPGHRDAEIAGLLYALVTGLRADLDAIARSDSWAAVSDNLVALLERYFTARSTRADDPTSADINALTAICRELGEMDGLAPPPSPSGIGNAISVRIEALPETVGTTTSAVTVGPLAAGAGRDVDVCIVVGAADGILPATRREDPLLPSALVGARSPTKSSTGRPNSWPRWRREAITGSCPFLAEVCAGERRRCRRAGSCLRSMHCPEEDRRRRLAEADRSSRSHRHGRVVRRRDPDCRSSHRGQCGLGNRMEPAGVGRVRCT